MIITSYWRPTSVSGLLERGSFYMDSQSLALLARSESCPLGDLLYLGQGDVQSGGNPRDP